MKVSQNSTHLGQSFAFAGVLVLTSVAVVVMMMIQSGLWQ